MPPFAPRRIRLSGGDDRHSHSLPVPIDRRRLLIGGGAGVGLLVGWAVWPRSYPANLVAGPGEAVLNAWLKIGADGRVMVAVPQAEFGQGSYTSLAQIVADELGADWRTVGVEAAPLNPLYANPLLAAQFGLVPGARAAALAGDWAGSAYAETVAERRMLMLSGAGTTIRGFEARCREAGAGARALLCKAAAARWKVDWNACDTLDGFVVRGEDRIRFAELAGEAATLALPKDVPLREGGENRLSGKSVPRIDLPAKVDGSANFAGDVRLPGMVHCAVRRGPRGDTRLAAVDKAAGERITGVIAVVEHERWVGVAATNWWAANRALDAMHPRFVTQGPLAGDAAIELALATALKGEGSRIAATGDLSAAFAGQTVLTGTYRAALGVHAAAEPPAATAEFADGSLRLWIATQAPTYVRRAAATAIGIGEDAVILHPMLGGGGFGGGYEVELAAQAAWLAVQLKRPVQLRWSRVEDMLQDNYRPAAEARMAARLDDGGRIIGWQAKIAMPATVRQLKARMEGASPHVAVVEARTLADAHAVDGAVPPYAIPAFAIDHHPADTGLSSGYWRGGGHALTSFFTESFVDELARSRGLDPFELRIRMLGQDRRLAHCLSTVASLGGWDGGADGSHHGLACHAMRDSRVAVFAEARLKGRRIAVDRLIAVVDCGRIIHPELVRQQIEGGLVFGMADALGMATGIEGGMATARRLRDLHMPQLADMPEIQVELVESDAAPGGASDIAGPLVAPAIANAIRAASGRRARTLPLIMTEDGE